MELLVPRYFSVWLAFFKNSLTRDLEYKANFIGGIAVDSVYYLLYYFFFYTIFSYVDKLGSFDKEAVFIFLVISFSIDAFYMFFCANNVYKLNDYVVKGDLDFILTRPIDAQIFVSFRYVNTYAIVSILFLLPLLGILVFNSHYEPNVLQICLFILSSAVGVSIFYAFDMLLSSLVFWFRNFSLVGWLSYEVLKFSMRPDSIYTGISRKILFSFVPMALISSVPTRILLFEDGLHYFLYQIAIASILIGITRLVWLRGLKKYESASS
jgi:ABC-2 type transport system permease protein